MKKVVWSALFVAMMLSMAMPALAEDAFAALPETFTFSSGAGAWATDVHINADGTFTGLFEDWDMGDSDDGYPKGTKYECRFSGSFADAVQVGEYEYSMRLDTLVAEGTRDEERIVDGARIITLYPYGFDNGGEFRLYLPGRATADLPEAYIMGMRQVLAWTWDNSPMPTTLPFYGLYNVGGEQGFFSEEALPPQGGNTQDSIPSGDATGTSSHIIGTLSTAGPGTVAVRNRPHEEANLLLKMNPGTAYPCVGQDASGWYKVYVSGYIGYVSSGAVLFTQQAVQASHDLPVIGVVQITSNDFANIRAIAFQRGDWLAGVSPGVSLDCISIAENGWYCVMLPTGERGYVSNKLCSFQ